MRSFRLTLVLLIVMIAAIVVNFCFINRLSDDLITRIASFPQTTAAADAAPLRQLEQDWQRMHPLVGLSVSYEELDRVSSAILTMRVWYEQGDDAEYQNAREQLLLAIEEMRRLERLSFHSVF